MTTILLIAQVVIAIVITIAVLLQKSSSIGLGAYSGSNESLFGAKGPAGFLAKFTFFMAVLFVANTLFLGYLYNTSSKSSIAEEITQEQKSVPVAPKTNVTMPSAPAAPVVPTTPESNSSK